MIAFGWVFFIFSAHLVRRVQPYCVLLTGICEAPAQTTTICLHTVRRNPSGLFEFPFSPSFPIHHRASQTVHCITCSSGSPLHLKSQSSSSSSAHTGAFCFSFLQWLSVRGSSMTQLNRRAQPLSRSSALLLGSESVLTRSDDADSVFSFSVERGGDVSG